MRDTTALEFFCFMAWPDAVMSVWMAQLSVSCRSMPVVVRRMTTETLLVSAQSHHLVELSDAADNHCELPAFFRLTRSALQAGDALEQEVTLIELVVSEGHIPQLIVGIGHQAACVSR